MPETPATVHARGGGGYERRDVNVRLVLIVAVGLCVFGVLLHALLWWIHQGILPEAEGGGVSPPVRMPCEPAVNARIEYRSSRPVPGTGSPEFHPEDLRADRQPRLQAYGWLDREKGIVRMPIEQAMETVVELSRARPAASKGARP